MKDKEEQNGNKDICCIQIIVLNTDPIEKLQALIGDFENDDENKCYKVKQWFLLKIALRDYKLN